MIGNNNVSNPAQAYQSSQGLLGRLFSIDTTCCVADRAGFCLVKRLPKPRLTAKNCRTCLEWAQAHLNWTKQQWIRVLWSDEVKINCYGLDGPSHALVKKGEGLTDRRCQPTVK